MPWTDDDERIFNSVSAPNPANEAYWRKRLAKQGTLKPTPPRSKWERFMDSVEETMRRGPGALIAGRLAPLVETGDGKTYEQRRQEYSAKEKQRRQDYDAVDPADSFGDFASDFGGGIVGSLISDPTNLVNPGGNLGRQILGNAAVGAVGDAALQGGEIVEGLRDEYDPLQGLINTAAGPALIAGARGVKKGVDRYKTNRAIARGDVSLDLNTARDIGDRFGTVTSTVRTPARNKKVGGAKNSYHLSGRAIDIARGKGVSHKQIERAYRRAGYNIVESLDEGDHSHFAFNFKGGGKRKGEPIIEDFDFDPPENLGDIRLVQDELPSVEEMARINEVLSPEADNVVRMSFDDPISDGAPPIDSAYDRYTPYVSRPNEPANDANVQDLGNKFIDPEQRQITKDLYRYLTGKEPPKDLTVEDMLGAAREKIDSPDVLTPTERQEMDASVPSAPEVEAYVPKNVGRADDLNNPANDVNVHNIADARQTKELNTFHKNLMAEVGDRVKVTKELIAKLRSEGLLPFEVGDRFTTPKGRELNQGPWKVVGYYADSKDPNRYGYRVERGTKGEDYESSDLLVSDPKTDADRTKRGVLPEWDRAKDVAGWKKLGAALKDILDDDKGTYRPDWREHRAGVEGPIEQADEVETRLLNEFKDFKRLTGQQRALYREARSEKASSLSNLQKEGGGRENFYKQLKALEGQLPKVDFESIAAKFTDEDFSSLANKINFNKNLLPFQKVNALKALNNLLGTEGAKMPTPSEIKLLSKVYSKEFIDALLSNRPFMEKLWHTAGSTLNIPRALMSSMDFSAPFRQGINFVGKKAFWKNIVPMFKAWASEDFSKELMDSIKQHPNWAKAHEAGLAIVDPHSHYLADREEAFMTDLAEKLPFGVGKMVAASNRAYSGFLNKLRMDVFNDLVTKYENAGEVLDSAKLESIGNFINAATGRGDMGQIGNAAAPALAAAFFSPRLIASRVRMLSPHNYLQKDPILRKEAWKSLLGYSSYVLTLAGLAKEGLGMDLETDPRHPDFMKPKIGNTRYDIMGGYQQYIRLGAQIITNKKITSKGEEQDLSGGRNGAGSGRPFEESLSDIIGRFLRSKESPLVSLVHNWLDGENVIGEPFEAKRELLERFAPMASKDIAEVLIEQGPLIGLISAPLALGGIGVQTYEPKQSKPKKGKDEFAFEDDFSDDFSSDFDPKDWDF